MKKIWSRIWKDIRQTGWILLAIFAYYLISKRMLGAFCPMVLLTGLPCPGCGLTRAFLYVITGEFARAWYMNPSIYLWIVLLIYIGINRYILGKPAKHWPKIMAVIFVVMVGRYIYGMIFWYPDRPPLAYTGGNLFESYFPGYRSFMRNLRIL